MCVCVCVCVCVCSSAGYRWHSTANHVFHSLSLHLLLFHSFTPFLPQTPFRLSHLQSITLHLCLSRGCFELSTTTCVNATTWCNRTHTRSHNPIFAKSISLTKGHTLKYGFSELFSYPASTWLYSQGHFNMPWKCYQQHVAGWPCQTHNLLSPTTIKDCCLNDLAKFTRITEFKIHHRSFSGFRVWSVRTSYVWKFRTAEVTKIRSGSSTITLTRSARSLFRQ